LLVRHLALAIMADGSAADVGRGAVLRQSGLAANVPAEHMSISSILKATRHALVSDSRAQEICEVAQVRMNVRKSDRNAVTVSCWEHRAAEQMFADQDYVCCLRTAMRFREDSALQRLLEMMRTDAEDRTHLMLTNAEWQLWLDTDIAHGATLQGTARL
jgi:hypothetical protein